MCQTCAVGMSLSMPTPNTTPATSAHPARLSVVLIAGSGGAQPERKGGAADLGAPPQVVAASAPPGKCRRQARRAAVFELSERKLSHCSPRHGVLPNFRTKALAHNDYRQPFRGRPNPLMPHLSARSAAWVIARNGPPLPFFPFKQCLTGGIPAGYRRARGCAGSCSRRAPRAPDARRRSGSRPTRAVGRHRTITGTSRSRRRCRSCSPRSWPWRIGRRPGRQGRAGRRRGPRPAPWGRT